jgi:hypothetical protein
MVKKKGKHEATGTGSSPDAEGDADLLERIITDGERVFSHLWDSGGLGAGGGSENVYRLGRSYCYASADVGQFGPYRWLEDALAEHALLLLTEATVGIDCTELSARQLARRCDCSDLKAGATVSLNGEAWEVTKEGALKKPGGHRPGREGKRKSGGT